MVPVMNEKRHDTGAPTGLEKETMAVRKAGLRREMKSRRSLLRCTEADAEARLAAQLARCGQVGSDAAIAAYAAIGDEIRALDVVREGLPDAALALPRMIGQGQALHFHCFRAGDELAMTVWGIGEPLATAPQVRPDVVLVPLLAFDRRGYRLGYGGGFYDRTLAKLRADGGVVLAIGLAFCGQEVDACPHDAYDQRLDYVLTPGALIDCR